MEVRDHGTALAEQIRAVQGLADPVPYKQVRRWIGSAPSIFAAARAIIRRREAVVAGTP